MKYCIVTVFSLILLSLVLVNLPPVQKYMAGKVMDYLSERLHTTVSVDNVRINIMNGASINGLKLLDQQHDTLLYAGSVGIRLTDWFLFRKNPTVTYIALNNAVVKIKRSPSSDRWNYAFISDAFSAPKKKPKKQSNLPDFELDKIILKNVRFSDLDAWRGEDILGSVKLLVINAHDIDTRKHTLDINNIRISGLDFGLHGYKEGRPPQPKNKKPDPVDLTPFNKNHWMITCGRLLLDGRFFMHDDEQQMIPGHYQPWHMDITPLNIDVRNVSIREDTITGRLANLSAHDRSGVTVKHMEADVTVSPRLSECRKLHLVTGHSDLRDYYAMHYARFPSFKEFVTQVRMEGHLKNATIGVQDIVYFAPSLQRFAKSRVTVSGDAGGTVANLYARNFDLNDGYSRFSGELYTMKGLPDIDVTRILLRNGHLQGNGINAYAYMPELARNKSVNLAALGNFDAKGNYTGTVRDFKADGVLLSALGTVKVPGIHVLLPMHLAVAYEGRLLTEQFDFSKLLNQDIVGKVTGDVVLKGRGFEPGTMAMDARGSLGLFQLANKNLQNISFDGMLAQKEVKGNLRIRNEQLDVSVNGNVDFRNKNTIYDLQAQINHWDAGTVLQGNTQVSGNIDARFSGSNIDEMVGSAHIQNLNIVKEGRKLNFRDLMLNTADENGQHRVSLETQGLTAVLTGNFSTLHLPQTVRQILHHYMPMNFSQPENFVAHQRFAFDIQTADSNQILQLVHPQLAIADSTFIKGAVDLDSNLLHLDGRVPYLRLNLVRLNNIVLNANGAQDSLNVHVALDSLNTGENTLIESFAVNASIRNNAADFNIQTATPGNLGQAMLYGTAVSDREQITIHIKPSEVLFNNNRWHVPDRNSIIYAHHNLEIHNLQFISGDQKLIVNNEDRRFWESAPGPNDAQIEVEKLNLAPLSRITGLDEVKFGGSVDGKIDIRSMLTNQNIDFDLITTDAHINTDTLGTIKAVGNYNVARAALHLEEGSGIHFEDASVDLSGNLVLDTTSNDRLDAKVVLDEAKINWIAPLLGGIVTDLDGRVNGTINFSGDEKHPVTQGTLQLEDITFTPIVTGVTYTIPDGNINVSADRFDLGQLILKDDRNNQGVITGYVSHNHLRNYIFNINASAGKMHAVQLTAAQGNHFYGDLTTKEAHISVTGPWNNFQMNINGTPGPNSHIFIPVIYGRDLNNYGYIRFKQNDTTGDAAHRTAVKIPNKIRYNIRLEAVATPDLDATLLLDPQSGGDQIYGKGNGNFLMEIPSDGDIHLNGNYIIDEGTYNFTFKQLQVLNYTRQFTINSGSTVKWSGDPFNAEMNVSAYAPIKARLYDLISSDAQRLNLTAQEIRDAQLLQTVDVEMKLTGTMENHKLDFHIDLPDKRSMGTYAYSKLEQINNDEKQKLNQVFALLVLEQFIPPDGLLNTTATLQSSTINNMSELFASAASSQITTLANKILGMQDLYVGVAYKNYNLSGFSTITGTGNVSSVDLLNRNEASVNVRKNFLKNRLIVDVGGLYDWGRPAATNSATGSLAGDFRIQYLLTADGKLRLNVFSTSNYDAIYQQNINRQGAGISYRRSFNNLWDFFNFRRKPMIQPNWDTIDFSKLIFNPSGESGKPLGGAHNGTAPLLFR